MSDAKPRILIFDIETAPVLSYVWRLFDENIGLNQIVSDWFVLSWAAKWADGDKVMYRDQRKAERIEDDSTLMKEIWGLLDQADIVVTQNGKRFDAKKLNARFVMLGMQPPSSYRHIDTYQIAKKHFAFTSNKLEYMTDKLCTKYKKLAHKEFPGFELWRECLKGNKKAWREMERYNRHDVLSLEELWEKLRPWDSSINFDVYHEHNYNHCKCGADDWKKYGYAFTNTGKFQRLQCKKCGAETRCKENLLSKIKRLSLTK